MRVPYTHGFFMQRVNRAAHGETASYYGFNIREKIFMPCKTADTDIPFGKRYNEMDRRRRAGPGRLAEERGPGCSDGAVQNKKQDACVWRGR